MSNPAMNRLRALLRRGGRQPASAEPGVSPRPRRRRRLRALLIGGVAGLAAVSLLAIFVMQSEWFRKRVERELVSTIERATGGRVELESLTYDWWSLTAETRGFVLHGTEPPGAAPLFRSASSKLRIRILSVVRRDIDLSLLVIEKPELHVIVNQDGSTNIPEPKLKRPASRDPLLQQLINLKVKHFEWNGGKVALNLKEIPLDIEGDNLRLAANYDFREPRYVTSIAVEKLGIVTLGVLPFGGSLNAQATVGRDEIRFSDVTYQTNRSVVTANGTVSHLLHPSVDLAGKARIDVREAGKLVGLPQLLGGVLEFEGSLKYAEGGLVLSGRSRAEHVRYQETGFVIPDARLSGDLVLTPQKATLKRLGANALGATFGGEAELDHYRDLRIDGRVSNLDTSALGTLLGTGPLGWHGIASGPAHLEARISGLGPAHHGSATVETLLEIAPGATGIPVQGLAGIRYSYPPHQWMVDNLSLKFPHSQAVVSGTLGQRMTVMLDTSDVEDLMPLFTLAGANRPALGFEMLRGGHAHFAGSLTGPILEPVLEGQLTAEHVRTEGQVIDRLTGDFRANASLVSVKSMAVEQGPVRGRWHGTLALANWSPRKSSALELAGQIEGVDLASLGKVAGLPEMQGTASATFELHGTLASPEGKVHGDVRQLAVYGERTAHLIVDATATERRLEISKLTATEGKSTVELSGHFDHPPSDWKNGEMEATLRVAGFRLADCQACVRLAPEWSVVADANASLKAEVRNGEIEIRDADGQASLRDVTLENIQAGSAAVKAHTSQGKILVDFDSTVLRGSHVAGSFTVGLTKDYPIDGSAHLEQLTLSSLREMSKAAQPALPFDAVVKNAVVTFHGPLTHVRDMEAHASVESLEVDPNVPAPARSVLSPEEIAFRSTQPISLDYRNGSVSIRETRFVARDTSLVVAGSVPLFGDHAVNATVEGSLNLQVFQLFDPNVVSSGISTVRVNVKGPLNDPAITGTLELKDAAFHLDQFPTGLERANGVIRFDENRATIERLTARSGGGSLSVDGFATFGQGGPIVYRLEGRATNVRIRYAAVSVTSTASVRFTGTSNSSLLSGTVTVDRAVVDASADIGALFAAASAPVASPTSETDIFRGVQMDLQVVSGPNFQLTTSLSQDVEADIDLRLRGSPARLSVEGRISVRQGQVQVFGNRYTITRGEIAFLNPSRIEPVLDVDLETEARGITVTITIAGTPSKLNVNYRSDPPMQPSEIVALLAVGRTPGSISGLSNTQLINSSSGFTTGTDTLLGQALSPGSGGRLERLFGVAHIKIDPMVQGIDNTTQARLTMEQPVSRYVTITYITNLTHTAEQIFRFEWSLSKQYSIVGLRDENGNFGLDLVYKKQFK
jgi:translocation and assembly module TamB